jgi:hypothetical protein
MGVHLYGVTWSDAELPEDVTGRQGVPPRKVVDEDLAAIVTDIDLDASARRQDLLAHAHVLEACVETDTVVPARFGIGLTDDDAVIRSVLRGRSDLLHELLEAFDGVQQVTVRVALEEEAALREVLARRPDLRMARDAMAGPEQAGEEVEGLVQLGREVSDEVARLREEHRLAVLDELLPLAHAVVESDTPGHWEVLHAAFLVARTNRAQFDQAVARVDDQGRTTRSLRYVGPQPPYSFVDPVMKGELVWA